MTKIWAKASVCLLPLLAAAMTAPCAHATDETPLDGSFKIKGSIGIEERVFAMRPSYAQQDEAIVQTSLIGAAEVTWTAADKTFDATVAPFLRLDTVDDKRTHWDLREAAANYYGKDFDVRVGVSKVYWGVTESRHIVDIVNQSDLIEEPKGDEKLGQPMVMLRGRLDAVEATAILMPYFRERTFPGADGRLRTALPVDTDHPRYESSAEDHRLDVATRLKARIDDFDIGLSYFDGTSREPRFELAGGKLIPIYDVIDQVGLDVQATLGPTLLKLEAISRDGYQGVGARRFSAVVAGLEHTLPQVLDTQIDVGLVLEYSWDDRPPSAPPTIYEHDFFVGTRFAFNDVGDSSGIFGTLIDSENGSVYARLEGSTRITDSLRLEIEGAFILYASESDYILHQFRDDSFLTVRLNQYL